MSSLDPTGKQVASLKSHPSCLMSLSQEILHIMVDAEHLSTWSRVRCNCGLEGQAPKSTKEKPATTESPCVHGPTAINFNKALLVSTT